MSRRMRQRYEGLLGTHLRRPDVILHHRVAAGKTVLGLQPLGNPLGCMTLLRRRRHVRRQDRIDDRDQRPQLRLARRLRPHITRWRREPAHLRNRVAAQIENTRRFATALTRSPDRRVSPSRSNWPQPAGRKPLVRNLALQKGLIVRGRSSLWRGDNGLNSFETKELRYARKVLQSRAMCDSACDCICIDYDRSGCASRRIGPL
jgi:hypothetical protein